MSDNNIKDIYTLFEKLYSGSVYASKHPIKKESVLWENKLLPVVEKICDELEQLGVWRDFSMAVFSLGIDHITATKSWKRALPFGETGKAQADKTDNSLTLQAGNAPTSQTGNALQQGSLLDK